MRSSLSIVLLAALTAACAPGEPGAPAGFDEELQRAMDPDAAIAEAALHAEPAQVDERSVERHEVEVSCDHHGEIVPPADGIADRDWSTSAPEGPRLTTATVRLAEGGQVSLGDWSIDLLDIRDSRCPRGVTCIQQGSVEVDVAIVLQDMYVGVTLSDDEAAVVETLGLVVRLDRVSRHQAGKFGRTQRAVLTVTDPSVSAEGLDDLMQHGGEDLSVATDRCTVEVYASE